MQARHPHVINDLQAPLLMDTRVAAPKPTCIASTLSTYQCTISESHCRELVEANGGQEDEHRKLRPLSAENESNYFQQAQW